MSQGEYRSEVSLYRAAVTRVPFHAKSRYWARPALRFFIRVAMAVLTNHVFCAVDVGIVCKLVGC